MKQEILCNKGRCEESGTLRSQIESIYDDTINAKIEKDMLKDFL